MTLDHCYSIEHAPPTRYIVVHPGGEDVFYDIYQANIRLGQVAEPKSIVSEVMTELFFI